MIIYFRCPSFSYFIIFCFRFSLSFLSSIFAEAAGGCCFRYHFLLLFIIFCVIFTFHDFAFFEIIFAAIDFAFFALYFLLLLLQLFDADYLFSFLSISDFLRCFSIIDCRDDVSFAIFRDDEFLFFDYFRFHFDVAIFWCFYISFFQFSSFSSMPQRYWYFLFPASFSICFLSLTAVFFFRFFIFDFFRLIDFFRLLIAFAFAFAIISLFAFFDDFHYFFFSLLYRFRWLSSFSMFSFRFSWYFHFHAAFFSPRRFLRYFFFEAFHFDFHFFFRHGCLLLIFSLMLRLFRFSMPPSLIWCRVFIFFFLHDFLLSFIFYFADAFFRACHAAEAIDFFLRFRHYAFITLLFSLSISFSAAFLLRHATAPPSFHFRFRCLLLLRAFFLSHDIFEMLWLIIYFDDFHFRLRFRFWFRVFLH